VSDPAFTLHAGPLALAHVQANGLAPADVRCVPAAAGGPKGLSLLPLDRRLFGRAGWFAQARPASGPLHLIGASIGAWRLLCAAQADADDALARLREGYLAQRFRRKPPPREVSAQSRLLARSLLDNGRLPALRPGVTMSVITTRARGSLQGRQSPAAFLRAAATNLAGRRHLAAHMERVVFSSSDTDFPPTGCDAFGCQRVRLTDANVEDALLASGSIPLIFAPVRNPAGAPAGDYWDGGVIDYHLLLPYQHLGGVVLYPHFVPYVTAGWLDKYLPWRRHARAHHWLDTMLLVAPSPAFLARLPNGKLPDRNDFARYGDDQDGRERDWRRAVAECERLADEVMGWLERPDPSVLRAL